jgi:hypothetical protein
MNQQQLDAIVNNAIDQHEAGKREKSAAADAQAKQARAAAIADRLKGSSQAIIDYAVSIDLPGQPAQQFTPAELDQRRAEFKSRGLSDSEADYAANLKMPG